MMNNSEKNKVVKTDKSRMVLGVYAEENCLDARIIWPEDDDFTLGLLALLAAKGIAKVAEDYGDAMLWLDGFRDAVSKQLMDHYTIHEVKLEEVKLK